MELVIISQLFYFILIFILIVKLFQVLTPTIIAQEIINLYRIARSNSCFNIAYIFSKIMNLALIKFLGKD